MNTPAHLIFGLAAFGRPGARAVTAGAFAGALIPDLSLYLMAGTHLLILGTDPQVVFGQLYFSDAWQQVFKIDNSIPLWSLGLAVALWVRSRWAMALCAAALLHLILDLGLHHDDGRPHFWPFTSWVFSSPVSYWDVAHYGRPVGLLEIGVSLILCVVLWRRFKDLWMRGLIVVLALAEAVPGLFWAFVFSTA